MNIIFLEELCNFKRYILVFLLLIDNFVINYVKFYGQIFVLQDDFKILCEYKEFFLNKKYKCNIYILFLKIEYGC